jgi:HEAT repeat protein
MAIMMRTTPYVAGMAWAAGVATGNERALPAVNARPLPTEVEFGKSKHAFVMSGCLFPSVANLFSLRDQAMAPLLKMASIGNASGSEPAIPLEAATSAPARTSPRGSPLRKPAILAVSSVRDAFIEKAREDLYGKHGYRSYCALDRLVRLKAQRIVPDLLSALEGNDEGALSAETIISTLGKLRDMRAVIPLLDIVEKRIALLRSLEGASKATLNENYSDLLCCEAVSALGHIGAPQSLEPLLTLFTAEHNGRVKTMAAEALGDHKDPRALDTLIPPLMSTTTTLNIKSGIVYALGWLPHDRSFDTLMEALDSPHLRLLEAALHALGTFGDQRAGTRVLSFADHPNHRVRAASLETLGMIGFLAGIERLLETSGERGGVIAPAVLRGLGHSRDPRAFPHLAAALRSKSLERRRAAVDAFKVYQDPRAVDVLVEHLGQRANRTGPVNVWDRVIQLLGEIGDERAFELLKRLSHTDASQEVREEAALALEKIEERLSQQRR